MNVFILCTGRSGSTSFIKACEHITNFTASHESRSHLVGKPRFHFPENHIEGDNRLSWQLGELENTFGKNAYYVHLKRDKHAVVKSFMNRFLLPKSMIYAYANAIKKQPPETLDREQKYAICLDYVETVNTNIEVFLKDKPGQMTIELKDFKSDFKAFCKAIEADCDIEKALKEFELKHNKGHSLNIDLKYSLKHLILKFKMFVFQMFSKK